MTTDERIDKLTSMMEARLNTVDARFERVDDAIARLSTNVLDFRSEATQRFEAIERRLDLVSATLTNIDARFPLITKAMLDSAPLGAQFAREKGVTNDLASRVARLEEKMSRLIDPAA